jgi:tetratricopeptide (TPR) repeat protein
MDMKLQTLFIPILLLAAASCAHQPSKISMNDLSPEQVEELNKGALSLASDRLGQMVLQAKGNEGSIRFLSGDLFLKANMSLLEGDYLTASVLLKHLNELVPNDETVQKKYAISLIRMNDLESASVVLEKLYKTGKDSKVALILAGVYSGLEQDDKARKTYQAILVADPKNEDACVFLGKSYAVAKETDKALSLLSNCAKRDPKNGMYDYYIGKIHIDQGQIGKAMASFKSAYARQPDLTQAVNALGILLEERENAQEAITLYEKHLKNHPQDKVVLNRMVQLLFQREYFQEVIPYAETLSDLEPENLNLKVKLGILYTDAKKYPQAIVVFKELLGMAPESDKILYYLGAIHQELTQYERSIEYFNQIPTSSGLYSDSSVQMANMLSSLAVQNPEMREKFLTFVNGKIEEMKELRVEFSVMKSGYFETVGKYQEAMEAMMVVQDEKGFSTQHKYYLANLYEKEKRFNESTALIMGIIEKEPKNAHAWNFLGYSMLMRGSEMDKAFEYIQTALKINPEDGYIRDSLGWYYYKKGDVKKALEELQLAYKKVPDDVEILKHLATIYKDLNDYGKAKSYFESALKNAKFQSDKNDIALSIESLGERLPASKNLD